MEIIIVPRGIPSEAVLKGRPIGQPVEVPGTDGIYKAWGELIKVEFEPAKRQVLLESSVFVGHIREATDGRKYQGKSERRVHLSEKGEGAVILSSCELLRVRMGS
jgi:hypothetical protein